MRVEPEMAGADEFWMRRAIALARRGEGLTRPNPPVGAVLVKNGKEVGAGFHRRAGLPHAEILAMDAACSSARGATLYVSLEPCSSYGRTPPCVEAILWEGIKRVVVSARDPNPKHNGRGIRILRKAGTLVTENVCADDGAELIAPFSKWIASGLPYVTLKIGMSLDGKIADYRGQSRWITSAESRKLVERLRRKADAIMVGGGTARADDPALSCPGRGRSLFRVIVTARGGLSLTSKILSDGREKMTIVATTRLCPERERDAYAAKGARVWALPLVRGKVSAPALLRRLGELRLLHVVCEGGAELAASLIEAEEVDRYVFFLAPRIIGGGKATGAVGGAGWRLASTPRLKFDACAGCGDDLMVTAFPR